MSGTRNGEISLRNNAQLLKNFAFFKETWQDISLADWDCPKKHFTGYSWDGLEKAGVRIYFETLGWSKESWEGKKDPPVSDGKHWDEMTPEQHTAAQQICFTKKLWEEEFSPDGPVYPEFRFRIYDSLSPKLKEYAVTLSYTKSTWNNLETAHVESLPFAELSPGEQEAVLQLGFVNEEDWDCYMNHYNGYTWDKLEDEDLQQYFVILGYNKKLWFDGSDTDIDELEWDELTPSQQNAAKKLCFIEESWNSIPLGKWECSWDHFEDRKWPELETIGVQQYMVTLGWDQSTWSSGVDAPVSDSKNWDELTTDEQAAARAICFQKEEWDGPSMFYPVYRYQLWNLVDTSVRRAAKTLGYDSNTWNNPGSADIEYKLFNQLSDLQQAAARSLEFREATWDCWQNHYVNYNWDQIVQNGLVATLARFGWSEKTWNAYDGTNGRLTAPVDWRKDWAELSDDQRQAAVDLCFIQQTWEELDLEDWDCSKNHYANYGWEQLEHVGVRGYFVALGWTKDSWNGDIDVPSTQSLHWAELNDEERIAARQICFTKSVWNSHFDDSDLSNSRPTTPGDKKNIAGIVGGTLACVAFLGVIGGLYLNKKKKHETNLDLMETIPNEEAVQV
mmetsp:Transcript_19167/g.27070  ORF Transcript_19167/g.27070 Transcript_19167/m.27070 type:complete len:617 (+) Transcript_19167:818-2668(+)